MAADGRPRDGKERRDLAGAEIAASQGGHDLSAGWVSDRREHIHDRKRNSAVTHLASDEAFPPAAYLQRMSSSGRSPVRPLACGVRQVFHSSRCPNLQLQTPEVRESFLAAMGELAVESRAASDDHTMIGHEIRTFGGTWRTAEGFAAFVRSGSPSVNLSARRGRCRLGRGRPGCDEFRPGWESVW